MCLTISNKIKKKTATENYYVYKILGTNMVSPWYSQKYVIGETYSSDLAFSNKLKKSKEYPTKTINDGLHYCCTIDDLIKYYLENNWCLPRLVVEFILPKGAKYYEGDVIRSGKSIGTNLGVADRLIAHRIVGTISGSEGRIEYEKQKSDG